MECPENENNAVGFKMAGVTMRTGTSHQRLPDEREKNAPGATGTKIPQELTKEYQNFLSKSATIHQRLASAVSKKKMAKRRSIRFTAAAGVRKRQN